MVWAALGLGALQAGASLLSGIGKSQSSAKQARLQSIQDDLARIRNEEMLDEVNARREALGRELLTVPETHVTWESPYSERSGTDNYSFVDVEGMMGAAEKAGFNPVTWLNAGGLAAYTQTGSLSYLERSERLVREERTGHNAADAFKMMLPEYSLQQPSQVPQQYSMLEAVGGAATAGLSTFTDLYKAQNAIDAKTALTEKYLSSIAKNAGVAYGNSLSGGGTAGRGMVTLGGATGVSGGLSSSSSGSKEDPLADWFPYPTAWERGDVKVTNPFFGARVSKDSADAETSEARYGDAAQEFFGMGNIVDDAVVNVTGKSLRGWGRAHGNNIGDYPGTTLIEKFNNWWSGAWTKQSGAMAP